MLIRRKPSPVLRTLLKLPAGLYQAGLGRLLGHRFLMLTHRGRRSGLAHQTVLEVIHYDPATRESVVLSAWGARSDWYRNVRRNPPLEVQTGGRRYRPQWRTLTPDETYEVLRVFERDHSLEARFAGLLLGWPRYDRTAMRPRALARSVLLVAFHPATRPAR